jgi:hypothetical protein
MLKQEDRKGDLAGPECRTSLACEPLSAREAEDVSVLLKAIADPVRLRLLSLIACHEGGEACVCDLTAPTSRRKQAGRLPVSAANARQHSLQLGQPRRCRRCYPAACRDWCLPA